MRLYIAEKPSLGRAIAQALPGPARRSQGAIRCGEDASGEPLVVSWCIGHLLEPAEPAHYNPQWKRWQLHNLPIMPAQWQLQPRPDAAGQLRVLGDLIREASEVVHAGDPDREGQLLVDEVLQWFRVSVPVSRVLINDLTPAAVHKALASTRDNRQFQRLSDSARARQRADWLYGLNLTRAYTLLQQQQGQTGVFSVGRVQTPVLGLVASRDRAIAHFRPHPYYLLDVTLHKPGQEGSRFMARWLPGESQPLDEEGRLMEESPARTLAERIRGESGAVVHSRFRERGEAPPLPLSLSILQITAGRLYGLSAQEILDAAQSLYEKHQLITYPRSDSRYLPQAQWPQREAVMDAIRENHPDLTPLSSDLDPRQRSRAWNDSEVDAHHAIIPTESRRPLRSLNRSEAAVYDLVSRYFLMQFASEARYREGTLVCELAGERFRARETGLLEPGWKRLEARQRKREAPAPRPLPRLREGEPVTCLDSLVSQKETQPPSPFTDATLLSAMTGIARFVSDPQLRKTLRETDGLGTEATRAGIIQTLFRREFLYRQGRAIHASERGLALIDALPASVVAPDRTAQWEAQLETVRHGRDTEAAFIERLQEALKNLLEQALTDPSQVPDSGVHCPRCRAPMRRRSGRFGEFWSCHRYPQCQGTRPLEDDPQQGDGMDQPPIPCPRCFSPLVRRNGAHGPFWGCSSYPACRSRFSDRDGKPVIPLN